MSHRILLVISGSIAAYKSLELIRLLRGERYEVSAILTKGGSEFITPLSVSSLTGTDTYTDLFSLKDEVEMGHIQLSRQHDLIVVAPASADLMASMAHGHAGDLASATLLAADTPVMVAPAMNHRMWDHPATQRNIAQLEQDGITLIAPGIGEQACGEEGAGRMAEPEIILAAIRNALQTNTHKPLQGKHAVVTSGPTQEPIDPVRYIGNRSSGKQGHAIASALLEAGADVTLITGPVHIPAPAGAKVLHVRTASEMHQAVENALPADIAICAAAVADWTPQQAATHKLKKQGNDSAPEISLTQTQDILATIARHSTNRPELVIGFAAETEAQETHAKAKREAKGCDWILVNDVSGGAIFGADTTQLTLISEDEADRWPSLTKQEAASRLVNRIVHYFQPNHTTTRGAA